MRAVFTRLADFFRSDIGLAIREIASRDSAFGVRLEQAIAITCEENRRFNAGAVYTRFPTDRRSVRETLFEGARLRMPDKVDGKWLRPTLAQALERTVDAIVARGPRYGTQAEIDIVDRRFHSARLLRERINRDLAANGLEPL